MREKDEPFRGPIAHGGDLDRARELYGDPAPGAGGDGWIDLSTGINPHAYALPALPWQAWTRLPTRGDEAACEAAARAAYGAPEGAGVVAGPGSQALIQALPHGLEGETVAIVSPTYGEHARVWRAAGRRIEAIDAPDPRAGDILVMGQPNNPDGRTWPVQDVLAFAEALAIRGGWLIVDEAFADTTPGLSLAPYADRPGLIVLRSLGKFYGLAGLRLGFALGAAGVIDRLRADRGPWAVSGPALQCGQIALRDAAWRNRMRGQLDDEADRLAAMLGAAGLSLRGRTALFALIETDSASGLHDHLARRGLWTRAFADHPRWLRLGLPGGPAAWDRLAAALTARPR